MAMDEVRRAELKAKGALGTSVRDFLGLDEADMQVIELRGKPGVSSCFAQ